MTLAYDYESLVEVELGKVLCLPLFQVIGNQEFHPALIKNLSQQINYRKRNFLPVMVKLIAEDSYEAIYNVQILEAARQAEVDFVWCIVVDDEMLEQVRVESGEIIKVPVLTSSEQDIVEVFDYIKEQKSGMRALNAEKAAKAIVTKRANAVFKSLNFLTKEKCGIGKVTLAKIKPYFVLN